MTSVVDGPNLGESALDADVLAEATRQGRVLLTDETIAGSEVRRGVRRIERQYPELAGAVAHLTDWL